MADMTSDEPELTPELLMRAYASGLFPMAENRNTPSLYWVDPHRRGILPLERFHISRSLARRMRRGGYEAALNRDFLTTVAACAARNETWINDQIFSLYTALHASGQAHSLEIWREGKMIGGVYGVTLGAAFFGESMFSRRTDGSKLALAHLTDHLRRCGFTLFDTQFITPHLASLGAVEISRSRYRELLAKALDIPASIFDVALDPDPHSVLQRSTQTS